MKIVLAIPTDAAIALRRFKAGTGSATLEEAATQALREYLISTGDLELLPMIDEDSPVVGST